MTSFALQNRQRHVRVDVTGLRRFFQDVGGRVAPPGSEATLVLVGDRAIHALNREFRGYDKSTDVLSFRSGPDYLGDVVISVETARRQARARRSTLSRELKVLALHGLLHLVGYDHETDDGEMRRIEYRMRKKLGITRSRSARR